MKLWRWIVAALTRGASTEQTVVPVTLSVRCVMCGRYDSECLRPDPVTMADGRCLAFCSRSCVILWLYCRVNALEKMAQPVGAIR